MENAVKVEKSEKSEKLVPKVCQDQEVHLDHKDLKVQKEPQDQWVKTETKDPLEIQVMLEDLANKEKVENQEKTEFQETQEQLVSKDQMDFQDHQDLKDHQENKVPVDHQDVSVLLETLDPKVMLAQTV